MDAKITAAEELVHEYCRDFMEKVFYFCLKKTGSPDEAEDLCSDISLAVISNLKKGTEVHNFAAWVWKIARNRYRTWAITKRRTADIYDREAETDDVPDDTIGVEDGVIREEDLSLLRRELAFISGDYREIVVRFYIDDLSVKDIAAALGLPEGTVKTKLYRARNILKEGMNMAREFGPKSYKPENVRFVSNGHQPSGLPWDAVQRSVQKNILLEAANNPSTVEDLAIALGIAVPYMQDEVDILVYATLLKKVGDKYVTNFPFISKETQEKTHELKAAIADEMADIVDKIAEDAIPKIRALGAVRNDRITDADIKWWAVCYCASLSEQSEASHSEPAKPRENGETWQFYGFENVDFYDGFVSYNTSEFNGSGIRAFIPHEFNVAQNWQNGIKHRNAYAINLLCDAVKHGRKYDDFTDGEKTLFESAKDIARVESDGSIAPNILCFDNVDPSPVFTEHPLFARLIELDSKLYNDILNILESEQNPYVQDQIYGVAGTLNHMRGLIVRKEVEAGNLILPDDPQNSTCTAALRI